MGCRISVKPKLSQAPTILKLRQVLSNGLPQVAPTVVRGRLLCRKIAVLFAGLHLIRERVGGADFVLRYWFCLISDFCVLFLIKSAPRGRLSPIEALPQTPQGTLSLDPASPLTPGLSLRLSARYARYRGHNFGRLCSFPTLLALPLDEINVK